jgi:hypothetical protein
MYTRKTIEKRYNDWYTNRKYIVAVLFICDFTIGVIPELIIVLFALLVLYPSLVLILPSSSVIYQQDLSDVSQISVSKLTAPWALLISIIALIALKFYQEPGPKPEHIPEIIYNPKSMDYTSFLRGTCFVTLNNLAMYTSQILKVDISIKK